MDEREKGGERERVREKTESEKRMTGSCGLFKAKIASSSSSFILSCLPFSLISPPSQLLFSFPSLPQKDDKLLINEYIYCLIHLCGYEEMCVSVDFN